MELLIQALIIISITAFFGMLEAALFTVPISRARVLVSQNKKGAESLLALKRSMARPIFLLVVFVNVSTVLGSIIIGKNASEASGASVGLVSALMTIGIIVFGDLIPKSLGDKYAEGIARFFAPFLVLITKIFFPVIWLYEKFVTLLIGSHSTPVSEDDLRVLSETSHTEGGIEADEKEIILNTFRMNDTLAKDIMTPRVAIEALPKNITLGQALTIIGDKPFSRIPVYEKNIDDVVGIVTSKDILRGLAHGEHENPVAQYIRPHTTVPETMRADHLLGMFQKQKIHSAIVTDQFGGTSGIITLEDVLEILVGEIMDETDEVEDMRTQAHTKKRT